MKKSNQNKGTTFVELIIAVGVIGVALLSLILVIIYGIKVNRQAKLLTLSYEIAGKEMETLRNTPFTNLINQTNGPFYSDANTDLAKLPNGSGNLTIRNYEGSTQIKEIIINISWDNLGQNKTTTFTTLITSGGINQ